MAVELTFTAQYRADRTSPEVLAAATRYARALSSTTGKTCTVEVGRTWLCIFEDGEPICAVHAMNGGVYPASQAHHPRAAGVRLGSIREVARDAEAKASRSAAA
jgi:hypothetical protein